MALRDGGALVRSRRRDRRAPIVDRDGRGLGLRSRRDDAGAADVDRPGRSRPGSPFEAGASPTVMAIKVAT